MSAESRGVMPSLKKLQSVSLPLLVVGLVLLGVAFGLDQDGAKRGFWASYLYGYTFWMSLSLGCTTLLFLHHTIRAQWSLALLRILESGTRNLPLMLIFFLPLLYAVWTGQVYPWADHDKAHHLHPNKQLWMNPVFWTIRSGVYFTYWIVLTRILNRSSFQQDQVQDARLASSRTNLAAPAGVIHVVLLTLAWTDWVMSLDPMWFSTIYGAWHMATEVLMTIAFGTFLILSLRDRKPYADIVQPGLTKDLGNMMLGFTMVYAYFTLSQFLIIWSANLPEEVWFFVHRFEGPLVYLGSLILVCQFLIPFLSLLSGKTKRTASMLRLVAGWIFAVRALDLFWQVVPFLVDQSHGFHIPTVVGSVGGLLGVGGAWLFAFVNHVAKQPLVPLHDNRLIEAKQKLEASSHA